MNNLSKMDKSINKKIASALRGVFIAGFTAGMIFATIVMIVAKLI